MFAYLCLEIGMTDTQDIDKIPDPVQKPTFSAVKNLEPHYVVIDLETTGLSKCLGILKFYIIWKMNMQSYNSQ